MRKSSSAVALALLGAVVAGMHGAVAAQPPRVEGQNCQALAARIGAAQIWQTVFWAERQDAFGYPETFFAAPCFASEATCKAWLYWARSDWHPNYVHPRPCRGGMPY